MKHTKGPWDIKTPNTESLASPFSKIQDKQGYGIASLYTLPNIEEQKANAHLISAAPDMFNLLEELLDCQGVLKEYRQDIEKILAKARGS
jgi:hypothetical protein